MKNGFVDETDLAVLKHLQENARVTNKSLADEVSLSPPGLQKRLHKLEKNKIIQRHVSIIDHEKVGFNLVCFVQVTLGEHETFVVNKFQNTVKEMDEVLEFYYTTGEHDYLLKVMVKDRKHLHHFLLEKLTPVQGTLRIRTSVILDEIKSTTAVPLDLLGEDFGTASHS